MASLVQRVTRTNTSLLGAGLILSACLALLAQTSTIRGQSAPGLPGLRYVPGSAVKIEKLLGEEDKERHQLTLSRTFARYGLRGTDLGYSSEHDPAAWD
jgi:hypothetical protein